MTSRAAAGMAAGMAVAVAAGLLWPGSAGAESRTSAAERRGGQVVAQSRDAAGDVRVFKREKGLAAKARRSIDIRKVRLIDLGSKVRFEVTLKDVYSPRAGFDQMLFFELKPSRSAAGWFSAQVGMSVQGPRWGYASIAEDPDWIVSESCDPLRSRSSRASGRVWIDVPNRCLPLEQADVRLTSLTGTFRSDAGVYSRDRARVSSAVWLR